MDERSGETGPNAEIEKILAKGVTFQHLVDFVRDRFGANAWLEILGDLKPATREVFTGSLLASCWYPYDAYAEVLDLIVRRHLGGRPEAARDIGANDLEQSLNTVYRFLYRAGSPAFIIRMSSLLWRSYFNVGRMVVVDSGAEHARVRIEEFMPPSKAVCWDIFGSMCRGLELSGARDVEARHTECPLNGDAFLGYEATWKMGR
ncbi:MAG: hypothetical protein Q8R92_13445 [Deltaproteobacteria bacterium]|nr:hypothetical protein [Deltaproteobacteria bacterium]